MVSTRGVVESTELLRGESVGCDQPITPTALVFASNRGPIEYRRSPLAELEGRRGSGGVVTALKAAVVQVARQIPVTWVSAAMTDGDRLAATLETPCRPQVGRQLVHTSFVKASTYAYRLHYDVFCNPVLWFLQHGLWEMLAPERTPKAINEAWSQGYIALNEHFGAAIVASVADEAHPFIMLQDYHLYLAAGYVRRHLPWSRIAHFTHVPWPEPHVWQLLPKQICRAIFAGMCCNDLVGLQTSADAARFLRGCRSFLPNAEVDVATGRVFWRGRVVNVKDYPISIDAVRLRGLSLGPEVRAHVARLRPLCGERTIVRIDRLDPSKNIVRGFEALQLLLEQRPELCGRLRFLAFLVPSRTGIAEYQCYRQEVMATVNRINDRFGSAAWQPIQVFYEDNYEQAIAALTLYDVLLVNPVADGMNLVAKEGPVVNDRQGVLVLSKRAGACYQLGTGALSVEPRDVEDTARVLAEAFAMPKAERARRARVLRAAIAGSDADHWLAQQIDDLSGRSASERPHLGTAVTCRVGRPSIGRGLFAMPH